MLISPPVTADETPPYTVDGERVYLALHGYVSEPALYANPPGGGEVVALRPSNLGAAVPRVVFAAVCWSGISVKASAAETGDVEPHTVETSLALAFLSRGAAAFVGCTGVHHVNPSSTRLGAAPLHRAFWKRLRGSPPARALLEARRDYVRGMFYNDVPLERAREYKTAAEFICLGLGY